MVGLGEQIQTMAAQAAATALTHEKSQLLEEFRAQLRQEAIKAIQSAVAASREEIVKQAVKELGEAQEAATKNRHAQWRRQIEQDLESARQHILAQGKEVTQRVDSLAAGTVERVQSKIDATRSEAVDRADAEAGAREEKEASLYVHRIALADRELRLLAVVSSDLDAIHEYTGRMTKECLSAMSFAFRSEEFVSRYHVPTFAAWLFSCDMGPAYDAHKLVLQVLQRRWPARRWTLKSPVHLHSLPALLDHYPDARIVITHRDPLSVLGSVTSLIATLRWAHSDCVDYAEIAQAHARLYHSDLDRLVTACSDGTLDPARVHHVRYADFMASPIDAVRGVYDAFGWELGPGTDAGMRDYLERRPQGLHGPHVYSFEDLGLDRAEQRARFARYQEAFGVPDEG
jgi:hypothetical protein